MRATITLTVDLDQEQVLARAMRAHQTPAETIRELVADLECSAFDSLRHKEAVGRLGVIAEVKPQGS